MFLQFVKSSKSRLNSDNLKWFVMGNESSDLDSVVGSLIYAYLKQDIIGNDCAVIPVCCISKDNLKLKKDVENWLNSFDINTNTDLIFLDDVIELINKNEVTKNTKITLLDHHKPLLHVMPTLIKEVIDHRHISYNYPDGQLELYDIKLVGSCCTIISEHIIERTSLEGRSTLLEMLRGVILLDTDCLNINNGKTTLVDISVVEIIEGVLGISLDTREDVYNFLSCAKADVSDLTIDLMVKRDLKVLDMVWNEESLHVAIPTMISVDVEDLLVIKNLDIQLADILMDLSADIIIGITCGTSTRNRIGILIYSGNQELIDKISEYILMPENTLNLHPLVSENNIKSFYQDNLGITRKTFIPIIERFFKKESEKHFSDQMNNCSSDQCLGEGLSAKATDTDVGVEIENEGAPYSLNTPLRSYSGSPDNRNSDIPLPSLNNRYTRLLVDKKRRKHRLSISDEFRIDDEIKDSEKQNNDDCSPRTFTPENTDDESISEDNSCSKSDNRIPLPLLKHYLTDERMKHRGKIVSEQIVISNSTPELQHTDEINVSTLGSSDTNFEEEDIERANFNSLEDKVHRKRQKLHSNNIESVANSLVNGVLNESESIIADDWNIEYMLDDWSNCYVNDEKRQIITSLKSNDLTKVAELLTSSLIRDCLKTHDSTIMANEVNNSANEIDITEKMETVPTDDNDLSCSSHSQCSLDGTLPNIEVIEDNDTHLGNMINEANSNIVAGCMNSSSVHIVENSSFNLYRRISNNQLDFSEDEKDLLTTAVDWEPKDDVIYSDTEHDDNYENHYSDPVDDVTNEGVKKKIFPDKEIYMDTLNSFDANTSVEFSLNELEHMPTPDLRPMDELDVTDIIKTISEASSSNYIQVQTTGDNSDRKENVSKENDYTSSNFEKYKVVINDAGYYSDVTNNNEKTRLITLSSCDLPNKSDENYQASMKFIFDYTVSYLESGDADFYSVVYFHCFGTKQRTPSLVWLHQSYQTAPYRLKKTLKHLYIVHPTIWVRAALFLSRFFINAKFYSKIQYISELEELTNYVPTSKIRFPSDVLK